MKININNKMRTLFDRVLLAKNKFDEMIQLSTLLDEEYTDADLIAKIDAITTKLTTVTNDTVSYFQSIETISDNYLISYEGNSDVIIAEFQTYIGLFDTLIADLETERVNIYNAVIAYKGDTPLMNSIQPWNRDNILIPHEIIDNPSINNGETVNEDYFIYDIDGIVKHKTTVASDGSRYDIYDYDGNTFNMTMIGFNVSYITTQITDNVTITEITRARAIRSVNGLIEFVALCVKYTDHDDSDAIKYRIVKGSNLDDMGSEVFEFNTSITVLTPIEFELVNYNGDGSSDLSIKLLVNIDISGTHYARLYGLMAGDSTTVDLSITDCDFIGYYNKTKTAFVFKSTDVTLIADILAESQVINTVTIDEAVIDGIDCGNSYIAIQPNIISFLYNSIFYTGDISAGVIPAGSHINRKFPEEYNYVFDNTDTIITSFNINVYDNDMIHPMSNTIHGLMEDNPREYRKGLFVPLNDYYPWYTTKADSGDTFGSINIVAMADYILPISGLGGDDSFNAFTGGKESKILSYGSFLTDVIVYHPKSGFVFNTISNRDEKKNYIRINDDFSGGINLLKPEDYATNKKTYVDGNGDTITTTKPDLSVRLSVHVDNPDQKGIEVINRRHVEMNSPAPSPFYYFKWKKLGIDVFDKGVNLGQDNALGPLKDFITIPDVESRPIVDDWDIDISGVKDTLQEENVTVEYGEVINRPFNDSKTIRFIKEMNDGRLLAVDENNIYMSSTNDMNSDWINISEVILNDDFYEDDIKDIVSDISTATVVSDKEYIIIFSGTDTINIRYDLYTGFECNIMTISENITNIRHIKNHIFGLGDNALGIKEYDASINTWSNICGWTIEATDFLSSVNDGMSCFMPINDTNEILVKDTNGDFTSHALNIDPSTIFTTPLTIRVVESYMINYPDVFVTDSNDSIIRKYAISDSEWSEEIQINFTDINYPINNIIDTFWIKDNIYGYINGLSNYMVIYDYDLSQQIEIAYDPEDYHTDTHGSLFAIDLNGDILIQTKNDGMIYSKKEDIDVPTA